MTSRAVAQQRLRRPLEPAGTAGMRESQRVRCLCGTELGRHVAAHQFVVAMPWETRP